MGNSAFESDIELKSPEMFLFILRQRRKVSNSFRQIYLFFFAEPGNITVETSFRYVPVECKTGSA
jgi:hypothetical protein